MKLINIQRPESHSAAISFSAWRKLIELERKCENESSRAHRIELELKKQKKTEREKKLYLTHNISVNEATISATC